MKVWLAAFSAGLALAPCAVATAQENGKLNILCAADDAWCAAMQLAYESKSGVQTTMVRKSTGEILEQVRREKDAPTVMSVGRHGGHASASRLRGAAGGLCLKKRGRTASWAQNFFTLSGGQSAGIYAGALGFAYNNDLLQRQGLAVPVAGKTLSVRLTAERFWRESKFFRDCLHHARDPRTAFWRGRGVQLHEGAGSERCAVYEGWLSPGQGSCTR